MSASVKWTGLDELIQQLTDAPTEIRREGLEIVKEETEGAAIELVQRYPRKTGTLANRVRTYYPSSTILLGKVLSTAPHSHLFHWGTKARKNARGANRGAMPAASPDPLVPIAQRRRARMFRRLAEMLERHGFTVKGAA